VIELEIDLIMIYIGKLQENGKYPDDMYVQYISPKMTLMDVKEKACKVFKLNDVPA
jgi:hypothetical protein